MTTLEAVTFALAAASFVGTAINLVRTSKLTGDHEITKLIQGGQTSTVGTLSRKIDRLRVNAEETLEALYSAVKANDDAVNGRVEVLEAAEQSRHERMRNARKGKAEKNAPTITPDDLLLVEPVQPVQPVTFQVSA